MEYKIINATPGTGQIEVLYTHNGKNVSVYAIDVPVVDGVFLTGEALEAEILSRAPTWIIQREQEVKAASGFEQIASRVEPVNNAAIFTENPSAKIRHDRQALLQNSDWTQLPDAPLTEAKKAEWAAYRQALRDITRQPNFPSKVTFPTSPDVVSTPVEILP